MSLAHEGSGGDESEPQLGDEELERSGLLPSSVTFANVRPQEDMPPTQRGNRQVARSVVRTRDLSACTNGAEFGPRASLCSRVRTAATTGRGPAVVSVLALVVVLGMLGRLAASYPSVGRWFTGASSVSGLNYPPVDAPVDRFIHNGSSSFSPSASASASAAAFSVSPNASADVASSPSTSPTGSISGSASPPPPAPAPRISMYTRSRLIPTAWRIVNTYPHDGSAFTQGLAWRDRILFEGTGLYGGKSKMRQVSMAGGKYSVLREQSLAGSQFGEGIAIWPAHQTDGGPAPAEGTVPGADDGTVMQLTWQEGNLHLWSASDLQSKGKVRFSSTRNQGWGLTHNGTSLIESDGSDYLHWWNPDPASYAQGSVAQQRRVRVVDKVKAVDQRPPTGGASNLPAVTRPAKFGDAFGYGSGVPDLNELEYAHGWVLANIWYDPRVAIIDPASGAVVWYLDFRSLLEQNQGQGEDCLNGLAYTMRLDNGSPAEQQQDSNVASGVWGGRLWVTGKQWHRIYEIQLSDLVDASAVGDVDASSKRRRAAAVGAKKRTGQK